MRAFTTSRRGHPTPGFSSRWVSQRRGLSLGTLPFVPVERSPARPSLGSRSLQPIKVRGMPRRRFEPWCSTRFGSSQCTECSPGQMHATFGRSAFLSALVSGERASFARAHGSRVHGPRTLSTPSSSPSATPANKRPQLSRDPLADTRGNVMDPGMVGGIVGGVIGVMGGLVGTYFSVRNTAEPRERTFMIQVAVGRVASGHAVLGWSFGFAATVQLPVVGAVRDCAASGHPLVQSPSAQDPGGRGCGQATLR